MGFNSGFKGLNHWHQTNVKRTYRCCYCLNNVLNNNASCFTQKHSVLKLLPTRHVINVLPRLKLLNAMTIFTPLTVFLIKSFTANKIYLHGARSGYEPESPVHIRTWTWNAGNTLIGRIKPFKKHRSLWNWESLYRQVLSPFSLVFSRGAV